jgi:putative protein-disulfide isomerase
MNRLFYVHDPMCSWCWGFSHVWQQLQAALPAEIEVVRLLGGLAADTDSPMPAAMQHQLADTWRRIMSQIPGVEFNLAFWDTASPRRATYPACRAVIAARQQGSRYDIAMTRAIQRAYYLEARNPSDESTLIELAGELGLDSTAFTRVLRDPQTQVALLAEISRARAMQADSFPSLVLEYRGNITHIPIHYTNHQPMLDSIQRLIADEAGWQT